MVTHIKNLKARLARLILPIWHSALLHFASRMLNSVTNSGGKRHTSPKKRGREKHRDGRSSDFEDYGVALRCAGWSLGRRMCLGRERELTGTLITIEGLASTYTDVLLRVVRLDRTETGSD